MNIFEMIVNYVKRHKKLDYIQQCIRKVDNPEFVQSVLDITTYPSIVKYQSLGDLNKDKIIYIINEGHPAGLFGLWSVTMQKLRFAKRYNLTPVIEWTKSTLFYEKEGVNGVFNVFEYYYKQVSDVSLKDALKSYNVAFMRYADKDDDNKYVSYQWSEADIGCYARLQAEFFQLNSITEEYVNRNISELLISENVLGVHIRGTDFHVGLKDHPTYIDVEDYLSVIKRLMETGRYDKVFLATDDKNVMDKFAKEMPNDFLSYDDVYRSDGHTGVHCSFSNRKLHKYWLGMEVIRDAYTLARCKGLVAGTSNVSFAARVINKSEGNTYVDCVIINKGITNNDSKEGRVYRKNMNAYYEKHK